MMLCLILLVKSPSKDIRTFFGKGHVLSSRSPTKASPQKEVPQKSKNVTPPKFYDTDSDDELNIANPGNPRNSESDASFEDKDLPAAILKDLLSDSEDELLCNALDSQEKGAAPGPSRTVIQNHNNEEDSTLCDTSDKSSSSTSSTLIDSNKNASSEVQNKLREIWGKKYENQGKNQKTAIKRSLSKPQPATKRIKMVDVESNGNKIKQNGASELTPKEKVPGLSHREGQVNTSGTCSKPVREEPVPSFVVVETDVCKCPVCSKDILSTHINQHLDVCLGIS